MGRALRCKAKASLVKQGPLGLTLAGGGESEPLQEAGLGEWLLEAQLGGGAWTPPPGSPVSPALTACPCGCGGQCPGGASEGSSSARAVSTPHFWLKAEPVRTQEPSRAAARVSIAYNEMVPIGPCCWGPLGWAAHSGQEGSRRRGFIRVTRAGARRLASRSCGPVGRTGPAGAAYRSGRGSAHSCQSILDEWPHPHPGQTPGTAHRA